MASLLTTSLRRLLVLCVLCAVVLTAASLPWSRWLHSVHGAHVPTLHVVLKENEAYVGTLSPGGASVVSFAMTRSARHGDASVDLNGNFRYVPRPNFHGVDDVVYERTQYCHVADGTTCQSQQTSTGLLQLIVVGVPTAVPSVSTGPFLDRQVHSVVADVLPTSPEDAIDQTTLRLCRTPELCDLRVVDTPAGTYAVGAGAGTLTFTPRGRFVGRAPLVGFSVRDAVGQVVRSTYTATVRPPAQPNAVSQRQWIDAKGAATFVHVSGLGVDPSRSDVTACLRTVSTPTPCTARVVTARGVWTLNATATVTYKAATRATLSGSSSVMLQVTNGIGATSTGLLTEAQPSPPVLAPLRLRTNYTTAVSGSWLRLATLGTSGSPLLWSNATLCTPGLATCSALSVTTTQGTYVLRRATGILTFQPSPTFAGVTDDLFVHVPNVLGYAARGVVVVTVRGPKAPRARSALRVELNGADVSFPPLTYGSALATGFVLHPCLVAPTSNACENDVTTPFGHWVLNLDNSVTTFTPSARLLPGSQTSLQYRVTDVAGQSAVGSLTVQVPSPVTPPNLVVDVTAGQRGAWVLAPSRQSVWDPYRYDTARLCGPAEVPPHCTARSLELYNIGTVTLDGSGILRFAPVVNFLGAVPPLHFQLADQVRQVGSAEVFITVHS